ncbi:hypothetical protein [Thalassotalea profundi]|uniref:Uncharacterized protein n=1 Tax=Thalassotalea profundi TaxID=2036687 RepID=A0ABQ3IST3_9GAMM|nr:hypothetical protein [Thalassotalea profundi]GHE93376.1 hypothetical protein GCM10011501_23450 [Thalassotalea profundi]
MNIRFKHHLFISLIILILSSQTTFAQETVNKRDLSSDNEKKIKNTLTNDAWADDVWGDDAWAEEQKSPWALRGFIEVGYGTFTQDNIIDATQSLSELTTRFEVDYQHDSFDIAAKADVRYDDVLNKTLWDTRELNIAFSPLNNLDVKLGRQVLTWGTGDYLFLNDLFAKDWQSFFSGRDDEYLKAASDSIRTTYYSHGITFDLAWTPEFTSDKYLTGERFSFYSPQALQQVSPASDFIVNKTNNPQWSARLATSNNGIEYAIYGYHGYWTTPVGSKITPTGQMAAYFPKLNSWGASVRMPLVSGIFNAEYAAYNSSEDYAGTNPFIANSQHRILLGYESEVVKDLTTSVQYYVEKTRQYHNLIQSSSTPNLLVDEYRQLLTLRLTYMTMQQKLIYSFFSFYSPSDHDGYIKPSITYRYSDQYRFSLGANLFFGQEKYSFFGQHQTNSNLWLRAKLTF